MYGFIDAVAKFVVWSASLCVMAFAIFIFTFAIDSDPDICSYTAFGKKWIIAVFVAIAANAAFVFVGAVLLSRARNARRAVVIYFLVTLAFAAAYYYLDHTTAQAYACLPPGMHR